MVANVAVRSEAANGEALGTRLPRRSSEQNAGVTGFGESLQQQMHSRAFAHAPARSGAADQMSATDDRPKPRDIGDAAAHASPTKPHPKQDCTKSEAVRSAAATKQDESVNANPTDVSVSDQNDRSDTAEGNAVDASGLHAPENGPTKEEILAVQVDFVPTPVVITPQTTTEISLNPDMIVSAESAELVPGYVEMLASAAGADATTAVPINTAAAAATVEAPDAVVIAPIPAAIASGIGEAEIVTPADSDVAQAATQEATRVTASMPMPNSIELSEDTDSKVMATLASTSSNSSVTGDKDGIGEDVPNIAEAKGSEKASNDGNKPAPTHARPAFAEWVSDFAHAQGAIHRSGDLVGALDRMTNPAATAAQTQGEALRPTPLQMLPIEIGMQAMRGVTQFQIRLDPAELGRVDVKLEIRSNGEVHANLVVDRVETLAMLKRDASTLQYAFEQAGLKQSADGLTFSLRGEGQHGQQRQDGQGHSQGKSTADDEALKLQNQISELAMRRVMIPHASVDRVI